MCTYLDQVGSTYYFRRVVPAELRPFMLTRTGKPRTEWKISLGTKDRGEAKRLLPTYSIQTDAEIDAAREALTGHPDRPAESLSARAAATLDRMQEQALDASRAASDYVARREAEYESREPHRQRLERAFRKSTAERTDMENAALDIIRDLQTELTIERERRVMEVIQKAEQRRGLPSPPIQSILPALPAAQAAVPLIETFDAYAKEQRMSAVTAQDWKGVLRSLVRFLGHDDAARFTVEDIDRWRDTLLSETTKRGALRSPRTVKDKYLSALRSTLNYAVSKRKLSENVASKVDVRVPRQAKLRERDFTNAEAKAILSATLKPHTDAPELTRRARRWIPWLCAYTGARVNEISQLRGSDVAEIDGIWTIHITPEAGTVKSGEARIVPLHPHLIEQGFLGFVEKAGSGALFYDPSRVRKRGAANRHVTKVGERLAAWVRDAGGITDPNVPPNHGWRHLFKTRAIEAGIPERIADAIQGHAAKSVGQTYGRVPLPVMYEAIGALPRFEAS